MKMPSGPASTPTRPPAASGWFTSTLGELLIMYRFGEICFVVNSILLKSVPCPQAFTEKAAAANAARDNCHGDVMTRSFRYFAHLLYYFERHREEKPTMSTRIGLCIAIMIISSVPVLA